jgi:hypothetical protein
MFGLRLPIELMHSFVLLQYDSRDAVPGEVWIMVASAHVLPGAEGYSYTKSV